jgi:hypothetical protein
VLWSTIGRIYDGAEDGTRTRDLLITNQLLYQLSYFGARKETAKMAFGQGFGKSGVGRPNPQLPSEVTTA